jgi:hypothetical protein
MLHDRPLRLRNDYQVESYDSSTDAWILDRGRDPREHVPLSKYPSTAEVTGDAIRAVSINAITTNFKRMWLALFDARPTWETTTPYWSAMYDELVKFLRRANIELDGDSIINALAQAAIRVVFRESDFETWFASESLEGFACFLYCHMESDGTFTYEKWLAMLTEMWTDPSPFGDEFEDYTIFMAMLGRKGLANLGYLRAGDLFILDPTTSCEPCP